MFSVGPWVFDLHEVGTALVVSIFAGIYAVGFPKAIFSIKRAHDRASDEALWAQYQEAARLQREHDALLAGEDRQ